MKDLIAKNYDRVRSEIRRQLLEVIGPHYKSDLAEFYVNKLEAEMFAQSYHCLETLKANAKRCTESLRFILQQDTGVDFLMVTSLDYSAIAKQMPSFPEPVQSEFMERNLVEEEKFESFSLFTGEQVEFNPPSDVSDGIPAGDLLPQPMNIEAQLLESDLIDSKSESFGFLEELTKIKEEEIKKLKGILSNLQQENLLLKDALLEVKTHLIALETSESELEPNPE